jgi:Calx-beta domain
VSIVAESDSVAEGGTTRFRVTRSGDLSQSRMVSFTASQSAGTADGMDYYLRDKDGHYLHTSVTIEADQSDALIYVQAINDAYWEESELLALVLEGGSSDSLAIQDNDHWLVKVEAVDAEAAERKTGETPNGGQFRVTRGGGETDTSHALTVYVTALSTAIGMDYSLMDKDGNGFYYSNGGQAVTIAANATEALFNLVVHDDSTLERPEPVTLALVQFTGYGRMPWTPACRKRTAS